MVLFKIDNLCKLYLIQQHHLSLSSFGYKQTNNWTITPLFIPINTLDLDPHISSKHTSQNSNI